MTHRSTTALATIPATLDLATIVPLVERANDYATDARAANTLSAYRGDWTRFDAWCRERGLSALPATPAIVAVYIASLADAGKRVATIERALAAIAHAHRASGNEWARSTTAISEVMSGIRRRLGVAPRKKAPIVDGELRKLSNALPNGTIGIRDKGLLLLCWFGAFRRSEVVALDVNDLTFTASGLIVLLRHSKTDQEGRGIEKGIPYTRDAELCPVRAVKAWLDLAQIQDGPLFLPVNRGGQIGKKRLSDKAVARIVKRRASAAGLDESVLAGHSLRAGFATTAAMKGKTLDAIMRQTGHRSERVARGYIRHANLFVDNAADDLV